MSNGRIITSDDLLTANFNTVADAWAVSRNIDINTAVGDATKYWRGDKTWQVLNKAAVGLGNVDNTSDANKPISTATQSAITTLGNFEKSARPLSMKDFSGATDYDRLLAATQAMTSLRRRLNIDEPLSLNQQVEINGFCDIACVGDGSVNLTALNANQRSAIRVRNYTPDYSGTSIGVPTPLTTFNVGGISHELYPATTGRDIATVTVLDASGITPPCALYFKSSNTNEYSEGSSGFAEIFWCFAKSGNKLYVHGRFTRLTAAHSGTVYLMNNEKCSISGSFSTNQDFLAQSAIWVEGYVQPKLDLNFGMASSSGLILVSNFQPIARAVGRNMRRDTANNRYAYLIASYGANVGQRCEVHSTNLYHAWTDTMYSSEGMLSGHTKGGAITGSAVGNTGHAFDTHMDSDSVTFYDITVFGGHSDTYQPNSGNVAAVQLRGHNATLNGLTTDLEQAIVLKEWHQFDSVTTLNNIRHLDNRFDKSSTSAEQLKTVMISNLVSDVNNNPVSRTGSYSLVIKNSDINYVEIDVGYSYPRIDIRGGSVDMSTAYNRAVIGNTGTDIRSYDTIWYGNNTTPVLQGKWRFVGGHWQLANGQNNAIRIDGGSNVEVINFGVRVYDPTTNTINNSSAFRSTGTTGTTTFKYRNIWVNDNRTADSIVPISDAAAGATLVVKDLATSTKTLSSATWTKLPAIYKLIMGGTGTVAVNTRTKSGTVSSAVVTYTTTGSTITAYPYFGDTAYEANVTITGTATAEIV